MVSCNGSRKSKRFVSKCSYIIFSVIFGPILREVLAPPLHETLWWLHFWSSTKSQHAIPWRFELDWHHVNFCGHVCVASLIPSNCSKLLDMTTKNNDSTYPSSSFILGLSASLFSNYKITPKAQPIKTLHCMNTILSYGLCKKTGTLIRYNQPSLYTLWKQLR